MNKDQSYLKEVKKLIQELENPLVEIEEVLLKLKEINIPEERQKAILNKLKYLGEIFEPRKNQLKILNQNRKN